MTSLLVLAPFGVFAMLLLVAPAPVALFAAAAVAFGAIAYDVFGGRSVKMLAAGSLVLFVALGCYLTLVDPSWSTTAVRLAVDGGVLAMALLSIAIRRPFTAQYARESVTPEVSRLPAFLIANYIITLAWTAALALMIVANFLTIYVPSMPLWAGIATAFAARNSAVYFTRWYPRYLQSKHATQSAAGEPVATS